MVRRLIWSNVSFNSEMRRKSNSQPQVLTVTMSPCVDYLYQYRSRGRLYVVKHAQAMAGGKGINVSRSLRAMGIPSVALGLNGGRNGEMLRSLLRKERIENAFTEIQAETRASQTLEGVGQSEPWRIFQRTPAVTRQECELFLRQYRKLLPSVSVVVISGRMADGLSKTFLSKLINLTHQYAVRVMLDTSGELMLSGVKARPWMIKPNRHEAQALTGVSIKRFPDAVRAMKRLKRHHIENIFITLDRDGAIGCNQNHLWYAKAPKVDHVSAVGCGDAFVAGFCCSILRGHSFEDGFRYAVAAGSDSVRRLVPGGICPDTVDRLSQKIKIKKYKL